MRQVDEGMFTVRAIVIPSEMEEHQDLGRVVNALQTARGFKEACDEVQIIFDGATLS